MPRIFVSILLLFGAAIIGLAYLAPEWREFREIRKEVQNLTNTSAELDNILQNRDALVKTINAISQNDLARIDKTLPQGPRTSDFMVTLERMAAERGVILRRVDLASFSQPQTPESGQPRPGGAIGGETLAEFHRVKGLPVSFTVQGSYESFRNFLEDLEKHIRLIDLEEISFSSPGSTSRIDFSLKARTYYQ